MSFPESVQAKVVLGTLLGLLVIKILLSLKYRSVLSILTVAMLVNIALQIGIILLAAYDVDCIATVSYDQNTRAILSWVTVAVILVGFGVLNFIKRNLL